MSNSPSILCWGSLAKQALRLRMGIPLMHNNTKQNLVFHFPFNYGEEMIFLYS